jgi:hypothetical protein
VSHRTRQVLFVAALLALAVYTAPPVTIASLAWCVAGWSVILAALAATVRFGSTWSLGTRIMTLAPAVVVADLFWSRPTPNDAAVVVTITAVAVWIAVQQRRQPVVQYLYLSRFPLAVLLLFLGLGPLCQWAAPAFLSNLLVLRWPALLYVTALALIVAKAIALALDLTVRHGHVRNDISRWPQADGVTGFLVRTLASDALAVPLVGFLLWRADDYTWWRPVLAVGGGFVAGRIALWFARSLTVYLGPDGAPDSPALPHPTSGPLQDARRARIGWAEKARASTEHSIAAGSPDLRAGYVDAQGRLLPGHVTAWSFAAFTLALYAAGYQLSFPGASLFGVGGPFEIPALAYLLLLVLLMTWLLTGAAFFLDRFRVSTAAALIALPFGLFFLHDIDFYYELSANVDLAGQMPGGVSVKSSEEAERHDVRDALKARLRHAVAGRPEQPATAPTIVVVAASGGGITAAYWTSQVLTGLQTDFGADFVNNIHLISAVSGGSAGTMFYVDGFRPDRFPLQDAVTERAGRSSLSAVAWGLAYPDFWRNFAVRSPRDKKVDRGWALEKAWTLSLGGQPMLSNWRDGTMAGWRPAVAFNATVAETGQRLVFSNLRLNTIPPECGQDGIVTAISCDDAIDGATAWSLYPGYDLPVVRAARLSAAFPFISPIARPLMSEHEDRAYHVADGGYYDNFGIVTAVEWLRGAVRVWPEIAASERPGNPTVLLIEIRESDYREGDTRPAARRAGFTYAFTGPLATMLEVRRSSQAARNDLDLALLQDVVGHLGWTLKRAVFVLRSDAPMSWQLAERERDDIWAQWSVCRASPGTLVGRAYAQVASVFGRSYAHQGNIDARCAVAPSTTNQLERTRAALAAAARAIR